MFVTGRSGVVFLTAVTIAAAQWSTPAGIRPPVPREGASILPGGRIVAPSGDQYITGSGPFGLAVSASGKTAVTSNGGPGRNSLTVMEREKGGRWAVRQVLAQSADASQLAAEDWRGASMGIAFWGENRVLVSEGNSGRIGIFDWNAGRRRTIDLNQNGFADSYTGDLAFDAGRGILYVIDQANFRVAAVDARSRQVLASVRVGRMPFALALSPTGRKLYVTHLGMFEYQPIPGADPRQARVTGLPFPAFGFPSPESAHGAERQTERGPVHVPALGDPNAQTANSVAVVDVSDPAALKVEAFVRVGVPVGAGSEGGSSPSGVLATVDRIFVSNAGNDSITVIDAKSNQIEAEIPIRIPGLESLRGVLPAGMAYHEKSGWLLVAEAGINAVGVIDTHRKRVIGHLPAAWYPTRVALDHDTVFVSNARGNGAGANTPGWASAARVPPGQLHRGSVSVFPLPPADQLDAQTSLVMRLNGFEPREPSPDPAPAGIRHIVLIVKENLAYDEVLGDIQEASNGPVAGAPELARFGSRGYVDGRGKRLSLKDVDVTPNHHAIARRWAFSDNFYAPSDMSANGHHWLAGAYPNLWTESSAAAAASDQGKDFRLSTAPGRRLFDGSSVHPEDLSEAGAIWHHFARHGVSFFNFGEGLDPAGAQNGSGLGPLAARFLTNIPMPEPLYRNTSREYPGLNLSIPDQSRATQFIREIEARYVKTGVDLPQFLFIRLPGDHMDQARPEDGYPYEESFVVDNDYALGRILEFLSSTKWWASTAVFITEAGADGVDHIDAHRTVFLCAGPWCRKNYVSHTNTSVPGLLKTVFRLLRVPPLNLFDAAAADLTDCLTAQPDPAPYRVVDVDRRIFNPAVTRGPRQ